MMSYPSNLTLLTLFFLIFTPLIYTENPIENKHNPLPDSDQNRPSVTIKQIFHFITQAFNGRFLTGSWHSAKTNRALFDYFDGDHGFIVIEAVKSSVFAPGSSSYYKVQQVPIKEIWRNKSDLLLNEPPQPIQIEDETTWDLIVKIYDGEYIDMKSVTLEYKINKAAKKLAYNGNNSSLSVAEDLVSVQLKSGGVQTIVSKKCIASFSLYFIEKVTMKPWQNEAQNNFLQYRISSPDCGFEIFADNLDNRGYANFDQILIYTIVISLIGVFTIIGGIRLERNFEKKAPAFRISMATLWFVAMMDYYLLILHIVLIFLYSSLMIIPCVIYLILIFSVERRTIFKCLKVRGGRLDEHSENEYRSCGFYFLALGMLFILELIFILTFRIWVIHISALIFVPQIIHNIKKNKYYKPNFNLLFLMGIVRVSFIFYAKYYPNNIFRLVPDFQFIAIYASLIILQLLILFIQMKFPRLGFGLRHKKGASRYVYEDDLCSICMGHLKQPSCDSAGALLHSRQTIETECGHVFHMDCLSRWVETKPACPVCRKNIEETVEDIECGEVPIANL